LIGVGLLYMLTGTLNMVDLSERLSGQHDNRVLFAAFSFLVVGLSLKLALFPLHLWLPNSYAYAPSIVTVLLAATGTKVAVYLLLRFSFTVLQVNQHHELLSIIDLLLPLALIGMFAGSIVAIYQTDIKRLLAYSSISQIGYILLGIALASERGLIGAIVHVFNHGVIKDGLFVAVGAIALHAGGSSVNNLAGLGKRMPLTMAAFTVCALSLIGIPGTVGFISPVSDPFCSSCSRVRLSAEGRLLLCLLRDDEADLRSLIRSGAGVVQIQEALEAAILLKPVGHSLADGITASRRMHQIGV